MRAQYVVKRFGFRLSRGWFALILIAGSLAIAAFWIGPFRAAPAQLQLVALSGDGRFHEFVGIPSAWADTLPPASEATARFPLILAVHNAGAQSARPTQLALSLPARFRVTDRHGNPLAFRTSMGNPLVRYDLPVRTPAIEPGHQPAILAGLDTLWLEAVVPSMYCTTLADSVPEFVSAPAQNPAVLSRVRVFYSFTGPTVRQRQAGLLTIQVDPNLVKRDPAPTPPVYETEVIKPQAPRPEMGELRYVGARVTWCGDPGQPVEIHDVLYQTPDGGRFFVLYNGGTPRKYLFDLNRDSIIELEMWDQDNDGKFESRRPARMAIPSFLMPYHEAVTDTTSADSTALGIDTVAATPEWFNLFYDTMAGPLRFAPSASAPARNDSIAKTDSTRATPRDTTSLVKKPTNRIPYVEPEPAFLDKFYNTDAGPFRFYTGKDAPRVPAKRKPRPTGPKLLGVPLDSVRRR